MRRSRLWRGSWCRRRSKCRRGSWCRRRSWRWRGSLCSCGRWFLLLYACCRLRRRLRHRGRLSSCLSLGCSRFARGLFRLRRTTAFLPRRWSRLGRFGRRILFGRFLCFFFLHLLSFPSTNRQAFPPRLLDVPVLNRSSRCNWNGRFSRPRAIVPRDVPPRAGASNHASAPSGLSADLPGRRCTVLYHNRIPNATQKEEELCGW